MLRVKGSDRFIWKTRGRHDTCGHTSTPSAQAASCSAIDLLVVRVALHREQRRPGERSPHLALEPEDLLVGEDAARQQRHHPAPALLDRLEQRAQLGQVGHPRRHRPAAVAVVGRRRARGEAGGAARHGVGHHRLHERDLVVGRRPLVGVLAHDVEPHRGVPDVAPEVQRRARAPPPRRDTAGTSRTRPTARRRPGCRSSCPPRAGACGPAAARRRRGWARWRSRSCPAMTDVTPWNDDGVRSGPRRPARRSGCGCR